MKLLERIPWWAVALVAVALVVIGLLLPHLIETLGAVAAGLVGVKATRRRSAARDAATEATEDHQENVAVENSQTEQREQRAADLAAEADSEEVQREPPAEPDDVEERRKKVRNPWS
tara:strand:+ start:37 stop:387 length:351 start_codon:yes stop_codon:yes gene_type:complete